MNLILDAKIGLERRPFPPTPNTAVAVIEHFRTSNTAFLPARCANAEPNL
jgi:hypothetical protein